MRMAALSIGLVLAASAPAWAADSATGDQDDAAKAAAAKQRVVCKSSTKANSRIANRECLTVAQWEERAETARKAFLEVQNRPMFEIRRGN